MREEPKDSRQLSPAARLERLLELCEGLCTWCASDLSAKFASPTRDHIVPRIKGGPTRLENEVACCGSCNQKRGHTAPSAWIEACRSERGLEPNVALVASQLSELSAAIERDGGMRKIRDYVKREHSRVVALGEPRR